MTKDIIGIRILRIYKSTSVITIPLFILWSIFYTSFFSFLHADQGACNAIPEITALPVIPSSCNDPSKRIGR